MEQTTRAKVGSDSLLGLGQLAFAHIALAALAAVTLTLTF